MKPRTILPIFVLLLSALACGSPSAAPAEPTVDTLPPAPLPVTEAPPAPLPITEAPPADPFTGTWSGPDPDEGSFITLTLAQSGNSVTGTFADTFSGEVIPGYAGPGSGSVTSATSATATFNMTRGDGGATVVTFNLTLSDQNNTITLDCNVGCPIVLQK